MVSLVHSWQRRRDWIELILSGSLLNDSSGTRLIRVWEKFVMGFGVHVDPIEAHNMLYVTKSTTIPIPKVYAIYQRLTGNKAIPYILMLYVPGERFMNIWSSLDQARKTAIARTLWTYLPTPATTAPGLLRQHRGRTATR